MVENGRRCAEARLVKAVVVCEAVIEWRIKDRLVCRLAVDLIVFFGRRPEGSN